MSRFFLITSFTSPSCHFHTHKTYQYCLFLGPIQARTSFTNWPPTANSADLHHKYKYLQPVEVEFWIDRSNPKSIQLFNSPCNSFWPWRGRGDWQAGRRSLQPQVTYYFPSFSDEPLAEGIWDPINHYWVLDHFLNILITYPCLSSYKLLDSLY